MESYDPRQIGLRVGRIIKDEAIVYCDYHNDSKPSASFNMRKGVLHCFSCGTIRTAAQLAKDLGGELVPFEYPILRRYQSQEEEWGWMLQAPLALQNSYLSERGVSDSQVRDYSIRDIGIGVAIPITRANGTTCGFQVRKYRGTPKYLTLGEKLPLWPMNKLGQSKDIYIVEGAFGVMAAAKCGLSAFAVMGASSAGLSAQLVKNFNSRILFDDDFAGYVGAAKLMLKSGASVAVPGGAADEDETWQSIGEKPFTLSLDRIATASGNPLRLRFLVSGRVRGELR